MSETGSATSVRIPTIYFIDDSATMREVIKIAFRKENIHVVTCADAASALSQFAETAPDAVITDVIMPDKDGYEVCEFIKQHERFSHTPVILMSGVVNKSVAEKAMAVKANELIRKPFQPQELITRVKNLLNPKRSAAMPAEGGSNHSLATSRPAGNALSNLFVPAPGPRAGSSPAGVSTLAPAAIATRSPATSAGNALSAASRTTGTAPTAASAEVQKLRTEVLRLELLVKKLQASLDAEKEYCTALEGHLKALQQA